MDGPRGASPDELSAVVALVDDVFSSQARTMGPSFPTLFRPENAPWLRTVWDGPLPVAHAGLWLGRIWSHGRSLAVAHLGAVCTRPEYRGRGLAGALLADALPRLRDAGATLLLISGDRSLYRRLGAVPLPGLLRYRVGRAAALALADPAMAVEAAGGAEELAATHAREPVRYERSPEDWRLLLAAKGYAPPSGGRGALVVRGRSGAAPNPAAYLLCGPPRRPREGAPAMLPVDEFAGDRGAVTGALRAALDACRCDEAVLLVLAGDAEVRTRLEAAGLTPEPVSHQGTALALADAAGPCPPAPDGPPADGPALASAWTAALGASWELPRNDGLQYI